MRNGKFFYLSSDGHLRILDSSNLALLNCEFIGKPHFLESLNDSHVAFPVTNCIKIKDIFNSHSEFIINCYKSSISTLLNLEYGFLLSGSVDKTIQIWNKTDFSLVDSLEGHTGAVRCLTQLSKNRIASGSDDSKIIIWNLNDIKNRNGKTSKIVTLKMHSNPIRLLVYLKLTNTLASSEWDSFIFLWDLEHFSFKKKLKAMHSISSLIEFFNGYLISGTLNGHIQIWNNTDFTLIKSYYKASSAVLSFSLFQMNKMAIGYAEGRVEVVAFFY
jgi:WD40 repeat protein